jgi:putative ABC transport system permease protein
MTYPIDNPPAAAIDLAQLLFSWDGRDPILVVEKMQVSPGERVFVAGPSGSGKSTLLGLVAGIVTPQEGTVDVNGTRISGLGGAERDRFRADHVGYIHQQLNLIPYLSVVENVTLACRFSRRRRQRIAPRSGGPEGEALRILEALGLSGDAVGGRTATRLSVGQQQRVAAARALIGSPEIIVADEPTSSLDADHREAFLRMLFDQCGQRETTLMFVSHDMALAPLFDRTIRLAEINRAAPPLRQSKKKAVTMFALALKSMRNRRFTSGLTILSIALSVTMLIGVERVRTEARASFANTISGTDLIVGARSGPVQLLLYSVFRIGNATNNISWQSYQEVARNRHIKWTIPISLGDSHKGYRVMGTTTDYFTHFRYAGKRRLKMADGRVFDDVFDAVLGSEVARKLAYRVDDTIVLAHGTGTVSFVDHADKPFTVVGVLEPTGTPVDRTVHVSLAGIEAIHIDWHNGAPVPGRSISADRARRMDLTPRSITAFMVGLKSRIAVFGVQRWVNGYGREPLLAILPGVALQELWDLIGVAETALMIVSGFVVVVGLSGMLIALMTSLNERRREMAVLRSVGARPLHVFSLIVGESALLTLSGVLAGVGSLYGLLLAGRPLIASRFGLTIGLAWPSAYELILLGVVCLAGILIGLIPGYQSYRHSLADGMTIRL